MKSVHFLGFLLSVIALYNTLYHIIILIFLILMSFGLMFFTTKHDEGYLCLNLFANHAFGFQAMIGIEFMLVLDSSVALGAFLLLSSLIISSSFSEEIYRKHMSFKN